MSLLYGENCYGKSTLCDILRSLAENNPAYITERATVPSAGGGQNVQVGITLPGEIKETTLTFDQGVWRPGLPSSVRFEVFDTEFIHRNVFTGLSIERQNHENITRFVLGDTGVKRAQRIAEINSELRGVNKSLRDTEAREFAGIPNLSVFLRLNPAHDLPTTERFISKRLTTLEADRRLSQDLATARARLEPALCPIVPNLNTTLEHIRRDLGSTFAQVHRDAETRLAEHLQNHTLNPQRSRNWVRQGDSLIKDDTCPFCGQKFGDAATALISAYQAVFNEAFEKYVAETMTALETSQRDFTLGGCPDLSLRIEQNHHAGFQYPELLTRPGIPELLERANTASIEAVHHSEQWTITHNRYSHSLAEAVQRKRENVHISTSAPDHSEVVRHRDALVGAIEAYNECITFFSAAIAEFKAGLDAAQVSQRIQEAQDELDSLRFQKRRLESDASCRTYSDLDARRVRLETEANRLQEELEEEQTTFLATYFEAINRIFIALGSNRFAISAEASRRGNMPTIQLRVSFNEIPITQDKLHAYFSESDRRALSFAIFWARIEIRDTGERSSTIVVMDDPVTSFDDARIDRTIRLIEAQLPHLRQIIVLSHYSAYLKTFFQRLHGQQNGILLARLFQDKTGSQIRRANPLDFTETDHERAYRRISTFIERQDDDDVFQDLRVFLETEVRSRYLREIVAHNLRNHQFAPLLDELTRLGVMSNDTRLLIEPLRLTLNTEHHVWTDRSHEEMIGVATDVIRFIYDKL